MPIINGKTGTFLQAAQPLEVTGRFIAKASIVAPRTPELAVYQELRRRGELTVRVYARPGLDQWEHLAALGVRRGFGDDWIKIGGLKGYVDGIMGNSSARFYEPYLTSGERGSWRPMMQPAGNMEKLLRGADSIGFWPQVHAIGDEAIDTILDLFEKVMAAGGPGGH